MIKGYHLLFWLLIIAVPVSAEEAEITDAFSPKQGATELVVHVIGEAQETVRVAAYSFTSRPIAEALVQAHRRGVDVEIVLDKNQRKYSVAHFLSVNDIRVRINNHYAIMHNKFMIIDDKILELGSFDLPPKKWTGC